MNLRQFTMAVLISALPLSALSNSLLKLDNGDFKSLKRISKNGETHLKIKLSKSGKAKFKKLQKNSKNGGENATIEISNINSKFLVKEPIYSDGIEIGPILEGK